MTAVSYFTAGSLTEDQLQELGFSSYEETFAFVINKLAEKSCGAAIIEAVIKGLGEPDHRLSRIDLPAFEYWTKESIINAVSDAISVHAFLLERAALLFDSPEASRDHHLQNGMSLEFYEKTNRVFRITVEELPKENKT